MIKVSTVGNGDSIFLIPGGPGLSSQTLSSFEELASCFRLNFIDFPGTNNTKYEKNQSLDELCYSLAEVISKSKGRKFIIGHSYGGVIASKVALMTEADGLVCLATPFSSNTLDQAVINYSSYDSVELRRREKCWAENPSDKTFKEWLAAYGGLYFTKEKEQEGRNLLLNDSASSMFFLNNGSDIRKGKFSVKSIKNWQKPHLFLAGVQDGLLPLSFLEKDASDGGFDFVKIPNANHFLHFDNPTVVNNAVKSFISKMEAESL